MEKKFDYGSIAFFVGLLLMVALQLFWSTPSVPQMAYSDFVRLLDAHQVDNLVISPTRITGELRSEQARATLPASEAASFGDGPAPYPLRRSVSPTTRCRAASAPPACAIAAQSTATGAARCSAGSRRSCSS